LETHTENGTGNEFEIQDGVLVSYNGKASVVEIPCSVRIIEEYAFNCNLWITKIIIPDTVKEIDFCAFNGCNHLVSVILPSGMVVSDFNDLSFNEPTSPNIIPADYNSHLVLSFLGCNRLTDVRLTGNGCDIINHIYDFAAAHDAEIPYSSRLKIRKRSLWSDRKIIDFDDAAFLIYKTAFRYKKCLLNIFSSPDIISEICDYGILTAEEAEFILHHEKTPVECRVILMEYLMGIQ